MNSDRMRLVGAILATLLLPAAGAQAIVRYVALDGSGKDGQSWATAYQTIQAAINDPLMVGGGEIWVKQGTYGVPQPIQVGKAVRIYGGYSGAGSARDWMTYKTAITAADQTAHCFIVTGNATIDGFGIVRGSGLGPDPNGAGVLIQNRTVTISNCVFMYNRTHGLGGAIATFQADGTRIVDCTFLDNTVDFTGGAIYNEGGTGLEISNCDFESNWASESGGAIHNISCGVTIASCSFENNSADTNTSCLGGAILNQESSATIRDCYFVGNRASYGGAIYNFLGEVRIQDCWFGTSGSGTLDGGAICNEGGTPIIQGCLFDRSTVQNEGGAVFNYGAGANFINCLFRGNSAGTAGGGVYIANAPSWTSFPAPKFINCTFFANVSGSQGGAVYSEDTASTFANCIVWGNSASGIAGIYSEAGSSSGKPEVRYSDVEGDSTYPGTGNFRADPRFNGSDGSDLSIGFDSPCLDAGDNSVVVNIANDYDNAARVIDGDGDGVAVVDVGAYEYQASADHLTRGEILQAIVYDNPSDSSPSYVHIMRLETDETLDSVEFQAPHDGIVCTIPSDSHTSSGSVETYHIVDGKKHTWEYRVNANDLSALQAYDYGTYRVVAHYHNGAQGETQVSFLMPDTGGPFVQPTQKPATEAPEYEATVSSPITISWDECTDDAANSVYVGITNSDSGEQAAEDVLARTATASNAYVLTKSTYDAQVGFGNLHDILSSDGTPFRCGKMVLTGLRFTVPFSAVYRFWAPATGRHFYTAKESEKEKLINEYSNVWTFEGVAYNTSLTQDDDRLLPVYRFWSGEAHFYTISESEKDKLIKDYSDVWTPEGIAFYAYPEGAEPPECRAVYRFWNSANNTHFFTISETEANKLLTEYSNIYTYEGVAFYAYPP